MSGQDNTLYTIAMASLHGLTPARATELAEHLPGFTPERVFSLDAGDLNDIFNGRSPAFLSRDARAKALAEAERELEWVEANHVKVLGRWDADYPSRLKECDDAPICLYTAGTCDLNPPAAISIVGTRRATAYGINFVENAVTGLAECLADKPLVVSGLALGIDISAHRAALRAGAPTVAVMATPINNIYPACHRNDAARIIENSGMVITEYRSCDAVHRGNFLARNRIIAGMADITIVVESDLRGGALCTAHIAADYNRQVGALPGRTSDRYSRGCNELIVKQQASMVRNAADIINLTGWALKNTPAAPVQKTLFPELDPLEAKIVEMLTAHGDLHQSAIFERLDAMPFHQFMSKMTDMEFKDLIIKLPGGHYRLK